MVSIIARWLYWMCACLVYQWLACAIIEQLSMELHGHPILLVISAQQVKST